VNCVRALGLLIVLGGSMTAHAQNNPEIEEIRELTVRARYADVIQRAQRIIDGAPNAHDHVAALELLAIAHIANRDAAAADVLGRLYARDPGHRLSDSNASPRLREEFERARAAAPSPVEIRMEAVTERLASRARPTLEVRIANDADAVASVRVFFREPGAPGWADADATVRDATATAELALVSARAEPYAASWYAEARAPSGHVIGQLGSAESPIAVEVPGTTGSEVEVESRGPLSQWWFWTAVGVVVIGAAVVAVLLLGGSGEQAPDGSLGNVILEN
jgi:hypothetical protein